MFCSQCGKQLQENAAFCSFCGAPTDVSNVTMENEVSRIITFQRLNTLAGCAISWELYIDDEIVEILNSGSGFKYELFDADEHTFYIVPQGAMTVKGQMKIRDKIKRKYLNTIPAGTENISYDLFVKGNHPFAKRR